MSMTRPRTWVALDVKADKETEAHFGGCSEWPTDGYVRERYVLSMCFAQT